MLPIDRAASRACSRCDETAYARHELETADSKPIPTGTRGKVVRLYQHNAKHGWSYDVDFENIGICWSFERELTPHEPIPGIKIVRGAVVPPGAVLPPTDAEIKRDDAGYRVWAATDCD